MDRMFCINCKSFRPTLTVGNRVSCACGITIALLKQPTINKHEIRQRLQAGNEKRLQQSTDAERTTPVNSKLEPSGKIRKIVRGMSNRERRDIRKANKAIKRARRRAKNV